MTLTSRFDQTLARRLVQELNKDAFINLLKGRTLFRNIPPAQLPPVTLEEISDFVKIVPLSKNKRLRLKPRDELYEIISGYVKIYNPMTLPLEGGGDNEMSRRALLAWRVPGELLGDFSFALQDESISDHMEATDDCLLLRVPADRIRKLAESYPQIYLNIAVNLAAKATKTRIRAQILRLPNIRCKIAKLFIELLAERGYDEGIFNAENLKVVNGTFHVKDIAAFLGYEYHGAQSGMHALIASGLLAHYENNKKSGRFVICDEDELYRYFEREALQNNLSEERAHGQNSR